VLTVVGTVDSLMKTSVGDSELLVPLVRAEQLKLWADQYDDSERSRFSFGVGIGIGL